MELILVVVGIVLILAVLGLLVWLIISNFAGRKEIAGQAAGIGLLQQQLEALKAAQDKTSEKLQESLRIAQGNGEELFAFIYRMLYYSIRNS